MSGRFLTARFKTIGTLVATTVTFCNICVRHEKAKQSAYTIFEIRNTTFCDFFDVRNALRQQKKRARIVRDAYIV